jgi:hypothetical protein
VVSLTTAYGIVDGLFYAMGKNIVNHQKILNRSFRELKSSDFEGTNNELDKLIDYQNKIIEMCRKLNGLYFPILVTQFIFAAICLCMALFQVTLASLSEVYGLFQFLIQNIKISGRRFSKEAGIFFYDSWKFGFALLLQQDWN